MLDRPSYSGDSNDPEDTPDDPWDSDSKTNTDDSCSSDSDTSTDVQDESAEDSSHSGERCPQFSTILMVMLTTPVSDPLKIPYNVLTMQKRTTWGRGVLLVTPAMYPPQII